MAEPSTQTPTTQTLTLEQRIARLEAIEAITALKYRYWRACDGKDPVGFRSAFIATGAAIDFGPLGSFDDADPITDIYRAIALKKQDGKYLILDMHHGLHPDIQLTSDTTASGSWTLRFRQLNLAERTEKVAAIEYDDRYVVEDGVWKIAACKATDLWSITRPLDDDAIVSENLG